MSASDFTHPAPSQFFGASAWDDISQWDESGWDGIIPLPSGAIRLTPPWRYALSRIISGKRVRRYLAIAALLSAGACTAAAVALTIAAFIVPPSPDDLRTSPLASNSAPSPKAAPAVKTSSLPVLPDWREMHGAKKMAAVIGSIEGRPEFPLDRNFVPRPPAPARKVALEDGTRIQPPAVHHQPAAVSVRTAVVEQPHQADAPEQPLTKLVAFNSAPFPYNGKQPGGIPFLDVARGGQHGHRTWRGDVLWAAKTFNDPRVLMHVPAGFDPDRPAVMVVFFHGYGATLTRDVLARQQVPAQISASGANAVLIAPQFAVDARDSSAGHFWEPGGFSRFVEEAAKRLAQLRGDPASERVFAKMPIVLVGYSGGFLPTALALNDISATNRVRGVVLLDAAYGELDTFANWLTSHQSGFLVSAYTHFTQPRNSELERMLAKRGVGYTTSLRGNLSRGGATFLAAETPHADYVTHAWTDDPIKDVLVRLPDLRLHDPQAIASVEPTLSDP